MFRKYIKNLLRGVSVMSMIWLPFISAPTNQPATIPQSQLSWHEGLHHPVVNGKKVDPTPYLSLPFSKQNNNYNIYQGFIYGADELKIHGGNPVHGGVDYELPYGTEVLAPADGYVLSSYLSHWVKDPETKQPRQYQGKPIAYGYGYFVRMYVPSVDRYLDIGHMSEVDVSIPFYPPEKSEDGWDPTSYNLKQDEWVKAEKTIFVKKGTVIGKVGYSGLGWGAMEWQEGATRPIVTDPNTFKSWDKPHIHLEEFSLNEEKGTKEGLRDPYDIYDTSDFYPTPNRSKPFGQEPLFLMGANNLPKYADE
jgi:murein DD-endopeptidase MepM/ murein hydrolase activator NlpD